MSVELSNQKIFFKTTVLIRLGIGLLVFLVLSIAISRILYPFDNGHYEAFNLVPANHLLEGKNPYAFALTPPYSMSPYGIIFYALLATGLKFFGFQLWFGRILSVMAYAVCFWLIIKITKKIANNKEAAWVAGLAWLVMFPGEYWIGIIRPDLIAMALGLTAFWKVLSFEADGKIKLRNIIGIALLVCAAIFTKQTFSLPGVFVVLRLIQIRKWREAIYFIAACIVLITSIMFILNYTSQGGYIWQHFTHGKTLPFSLTYSLEWTLQVLELPATIIFMVFLFIFVNSNHHIFNRLKHENLSGIWGSPGFLVFSYFIISFVWNSLSSGRVGASLNYFLESSFFMALVCGLIYANLKKNLFPQLAISFLILLTLGGVLQLFRLTEKEYFRWRVSNYYREVENKVGQLITPGSTCLSVDANLVMRSGCTINFDDIGEYSSGWSPVLDKIFESEIQAGRYKVIILHSDDFDKKFPNYRLVPMSQPPPPGGYALTTFLYVRSDEPLR